MGLRLFELLYAGKHFIITNKSSTSFLNSTFYHSSKDALNLQWYQDEFPKVKELTRLLANVDTVNGRLVDVNSNTTVFDDGIEREMCTFKSLVRVFVGSPFVQHRMKHVVASFTTSTQHESSRGLNNGALSGGQIVQSCLKFLTKISVCSDPESSSWMKLSPSKTVDSYDPRKWEDVLVMFNDLTECCRSENMLKLHVAKAEVMKEGLLHIRDVLVDNSIGYKEAQHQESLVKKKLSKMLGHSSRCLFTLLLYYLYGRVADIKVDMCGGVYANGSDGKFCLFMGRILTSDSEKMVGCGVKQLDRALGIF
uniref:Uncharacterized protein n=1 Tax=Cajanus cajan TaxID=3821 RepID=A0A151T8G4_CAJCA|nr:hypothetical protein KK1_017918 [Cajanus cajan]